MDFDFDKIIQRKNTNCIKWDFNKKIFGNEDIIPLWIADMDFESPKEIIDSIKTRTNHGIFGYTGIPAEFFSSITNWLSKRHSFNVNKNWIIDTTGVVPSIVFSLLSFTKPKDKVLIQSPVYHPFFSSIENNDREIVNCPLKFENNNYTMNFESIEQKFKDGVSATIFCSPHNPVSRVWTKEELLKFASLCLKYNVFIISDEIHSDIVYKPNKHIPIASLSNEIAENTITLMSPSKTFNIAGLHSAFAIIPKREFFVKFKRTLDKYYLDRSNILGVIALEAAYTYGEAWLDKLITYLDNNINFLIKFLHEKIPSIKVIKPEGTYLLWLDCTALGMDNKTLQKFFVKKAMVGLSNGDAFGEGSDGFFRINVACPRKLLKEALERIEAAVVKLF